MRGSLAACKSVSRPELGLPLFRALLFAGLFASSRCVGIALCSSFTSFYTALLAARLFAFGLGRSLSGSGGSGRWTGSVFSASGWWLYVLAGFACSRSAARWIGHCQRCGLQDSELDAAIFCATVQRAVVRNWVLWTIALGTQPSGLDSMLD